MVEVAIDGGKYVSETGGCGLFEFVGVLGAVGGGELLLLGVVCVVVVDGVPGPEGGTFIVDVAGTAGGVARPG